MAETWSGEFYCVKCKEKRQAEGNVEVNEKGTKMAKATAPSAARSSTASSARPEHLSATRLADRGRPDARPRLGTGAVAVVRGLWTTRDARLRARVLPSPARRAPPAHPALVCSPRPAGLAARTRARPGHAAARSPTAARGARRPGERRRADAAAHPCDPRDAGALLDHAALPARARGTGRRPPRAPPRSARRRPRGRSGWRAGQQPGSRSAAARRVRRRGAESRGSPPSRQAPACRPVAAPPAAGRASLGCCSASASPTGSCSTRGCAAGRRTWWCGWSRAGPCSGPFVRARPDRLPALPRRPPQRADPRRPLLVRQHAAPAPGDRDDGAARAGGPGARHARARPGRCAT